MFQRRNQTCRAAVFRAPGAPLELQEFDIPRPAEREALVQITLCTICGSDLHTIRGKRNEPTPAILGHEILGKVTEFGDPPPLDVDGNPLRKGDRVTWSTCVSCSRCDRCNAGFPQKCRTLFKYGHAVAEGRYALSGGLAEYILLRRGSAVIPLSDALADQVACPVNCATATIAAAYRIADQVAGKRILVLGAGMLGLTAAAFGKWRQASEVTVCDLDAGRLQKASALGADNIVDWKSHDLDDSLPEIVLECSGAPDAVELACHVGDIGSKVILVGSVKQSPPVPLDAQNTVRACLSIHGIHNYTPKDLGTAVEFLLHSSGRFPLAELVETTYPLTAVNDAIEFAFENRPIRVAIRP